MPEMPTVRRWICVATIPSRPQTSETDGVRQTKAQIGSVAAIAIAVTSATAFAGLYLASRRLRVGIAGALILTYLVTTVMVFYFGALRAGDPGCAGWQ
jgi:hypothetical protein